MSIVEDIIFPQEIQFFEDSAMQRARQLDCQLGKGIPYPLVPASTLFPFCVPSGETATLVCASSDDPTDVSVSLTASESDFVYYDGASAVDAPIGIYYLDTGDYVSDWFEVYDDSDEDMIERITEIAYRDDGYIGVFEYPEDYYNKVWLDGEFRKPSYSLIREAKLDGDDNPFYSHQRWEKRIAIDVKVTEPTVDALTVLPLHDTIEITTKGVTYEGLTDAVFEEPDWDETLTCIATMGVSFCLKKIIKRLCGEIEIPEPPEPPTPPVETVPIYFKLTTDCDEGNTLIAGATISVTAEGFSQTNIGNYLFNLPVNTVYSVSITHDDFTAIPDYPLAVVEESFTECIEMEFVGAIVGEYYEKYGGFVAAINGGEMLVVAGSDLNYGVAMSFGAAQSFASQSHDFGFYDWRLPTEEELADIIYPILSGEFQAEKYWTSTSVSGGVAYVVDMSTGASEEMNITKHAYVRAVRTHTI